MNFIKCTIYYKPTEGEPLDSKSEQAIQHVLGEFPKTLEHLLGSDDPETRVNITEITVNITTKVSTQQVKDTIEKQLKQDALLDALRCKYEFLGEVDDFGLFR